MAPQCFWFLLGYLYYFSCSALATLPPVDQRALGVCLHIYLERDYPDIQRIINPGTIRKPNGGGSERGRVLLDGPMLEASCQHLQRMTRCFARVLLRMQYFEDFREFRRLLVAMESVLSQLCGKIDLMRHRFLPFLQTLQCMEEVRESTPCGEQLPSNVWQQLLRLEEDSTFCGPLSRQISCVRASGTMSQKCGVIADELFSNISNVFLSNWCSSASSLQPLTSVLVIVVLLSRL